MREIRAGVLCALMAALGLGQTAPFQVLDGSLPYGTFPDAVGDVDYDGDQDAVCKGFAWINDGHARFTAVPVPSLQFNRVRAVLIDLNADGLLDLLSIDYNGGVRVDLGVPGLAFSGSLFVLPPFAPGTFANNLATGDVDNDGDIDVLIGLQGWNGSNYPPPAAPALWLNDGFGFFTASPAGALPVLALASSSLLLRDLDTDGDLDALFAGDGMMPQIQALLNSGGTFVTAPQWQWPAPTMSVFEIGSFNGDAFPDLIFAGGAPGSTSIITGSATGFAAGGSVSNGLFNDLRTVDVNGDGLDEVVAHAVFGGGLTLHQVSGSPPALGPAIQSWPTSGLLIESARDLDGDGDRDLFAFDTSQSLLLMNQGNGSLLLLPGRTTGDGYLEAALSGDLDGDQDPDIFGFLNASFTIGTAMNDGDGYFVPGPGVPITLPANPWYYSLFAFDRDGDGDPDVYAARNTWTANTTAPNDVVFDRTAGTFVQSMTVSGTGDTTVFKAADLDGDGDQDILLGRRTISGNGMTGPMLLLRNLGAAGLAPPVPIGGNHATYDLEVGDFDGNGMLDVFQVNRIPMGADPCVLYLNVGGTYTALTQGFSGYWSAAGDLNADGMADLIVDGQMLFAAGGGAFIPGAPPPSPLYAPATLADLDLDGDLDLFESQGTVMLNGGAGVFGPPISYLPRGRVFATDARRRSTATAIRTPSTAVPSC